MCKKEVFHWFNPISNQLRTFVANRQMPQNMRFWRTFFASKTVVADIFLDKSHVWVTIDKQF